MARKSLKDDMLDAAERVIARRGAATTLEAIAAEAGVSKGGLLYHFPSKREVILALFERFERRLGEAEEKVLATLPDKPGKALKAYVVTHNQKDCLKVIPPSKLVAFMDDPEFHGLAAEMRRRAFEKLASDKDVPSDLVAVIALAIDGMWLQQMLEFDLITEEFRQRIVKEMFHLIDRAVENAASVSRRGRKTKAGKNKDSDQA